MFVCIQVPGICCACSGLLTFVCVCVHACARALQEPSRELLLRCTMLSKGDRSEPAVLGGPRWMSGVRVKMCFCPLFSGDFHSALSRAHSPGRGAPLLPTCAAANVPGYDPQWVGGGWRRRRLGKHGSTSFLFAFVNPPASSSLNRGKFPLTKYRLCISHMVPPHPPCLTRSTAAHPHCIFRGWKAQKAGNAVIDAYHGCSESGAPSRARADGGFFGTGRGTCFSLRQLLVQTSSCISQLSCITQTHTHMLQSEEMVAFDLHRWGLARQRYRFIIKTSFFFYLQKVLLLFLNKLNKTKQKN